MGPDVDYFIVVPCKCGVRSRKTFCGFAGLDVFRTALPPCSGGWRSRNRAARRPGARHPLECKTETFIWSVVKRDCITTSTTAHIHTQRCRSTYSILKNKPYH